MTVTERLARATDRLFDHARHPRAFKVEDADAIDGDLHPLRSRKYSVLVTFRRDGTPVPSPVWCAINQDGRGYIKTAAEVGKVKRIRHDHRVLIAPSTARGRATGPAIRATARILPPDEWPHAEQTLAAAYGFGRRASETLLAATGPAEYIEIRSRSPH